MSPESGLDALQRDKPKYGGRPWPQARDEMVARGSTTIADLAAKQIESFYRSTQSAQRAKSKFMGLFGGNNR